jgi:hypothetical protein
MSLQSGETLRLRICRASCGHSPWHIVNRRCRPHSARSLFWTFCPEIGSPADPVRWFVFKSAEGNYAGPKAISTKGRRPVGASSAISSSRTGSSDGSPLRARVLQPCDAAPRATPPLPRKTLAALRFGSLSAGSSYLGALQGGVGYARWPAPASTIRSTRSTR